MRGDTRRLGDGPNAIGRNLIPHRYRRWRHAYRYGKFGGPTALSRQICFQLFHGAYLSPTEISVKLIFQWGFMEWRFVASDH